MTTDYVPQICRIALLRRFALAAGAILLIFCMSVYVSTPWVKVAIAIATMSALMTWRRIFTSELGPLLAIIIYDVAVTLVFPGPKPDILTVLQRPLFYSLCLLLCSVCLHGKDLRAQYFVMFGILAVSMVGAIGDISGHDMTSLLPFEMPEENFFDQTTIGSGGVARIRGFFPESGVLGAVSMCIVTCLSLGALTLMAYRLRRRTALAALCGSTLAGLAILGLTVTKSGICLTVAGLSGYLVVLIFSRYKAHQKVALAIITAAVLCAVGLFYASDDIASYMKGEVGGIIHLRDANPAMMRSQAGMFTRIECWKLAFYCARYYPLGVGVWGHGSVLVKDTAVTPTPEMLYFFQEDIFGLKNALANLIAETGFVGLGLLSYWLWKSFIQPARRLVRERTPGKVLVAGLYIASAFCSLAFMFSCELYPYFSLLLLLKLHADAVAWEIEKATPAAVDMDDSAFEEEILPDTPPCALTP
jgi:hypothetical protein